MPQHSKLTRILWKDTIQAPLVAQYAEQLWIVPTQLAYDGSVTLSHFDPYRRVHLFVYANYYMGVTVEKPFEVLFPCPVFSEHPYFDKTLFAAPHLIDLFTSVSELCLADYSK